MNKKKKKGKIYCFDIDGVVCHTENGDYRRAIPIRSRIEKINKLFWQEGNQVFFFTARGTLTGKNWERVTRNQFREWGLCYDDIIFGKPFYDIVVDDKAANDLDFFEDKRTV